MDVDMDLGMPIDLTQVSHAFDPENQLEEHGNVELDEADRALLVEPSTKGASSRASSAGAGVSFLRRTEYISTDQMRIKRAAQRAALERQQNPEERIQRIEATFEHCQAPLDSLKHPKKRNVHAVRALPLLPDVKQMDLVYLAVSMTGSASLTKANPPLSKLQLETSVFNNISVGEDEEDLQEWMGLFVPEDDDAAQKFLDRLEDTRDTLPASEAGMEPVSLKLVQENDIDFIANKNDFDEVAISVGDDACYYVPIVGRTTLKRRRVAPLKQQLKDETIDKLELVLQEMTAEESIERDAIRSKYDPVTYSSA